MISQSLNDRLTRCAKSTPAGELLRRYWQPAALQDEISGGLPLAINLMGEQLALISSDANDDEFVLATRQAAAQQSGIEYPDSESIQLDAAGPVYPTTVKNGIVFAYLGSAEPPQFPQFDCFRAPGSHSFAFKGLWSCNWLQALEIGIDPAHASYLHRFLQDEDPESGYGKQFRDTTAQSDIPMTQILREYPKPDINVEETAYGLKITALRHLQNEMTHVRVTNQIFPTAICIPMSREMTITQWHVPIDDTHCYWYTIFTSFQDPVDKKKMRQQRLQEHRLPDYAPLKNKSNNYHYDPDEQHTTTYTGMGLDINVHDQWAVEGMGAVQDRTREHLGRSDVAIIRYRRMLRKAISAVEENPESQDLPMLNGTNLQSLKGPLSNDSIARNKDWQAAAGMADRQRRESCPWNAKL